jgi:hypothetical protein
MESEELKLAPTVSWAGGKKESVLPVGTEGCRVIVREYWEREDGKLKLKNVTLSSDKGP